MPGKVAKTKDGGKVADIPETTPEAPADHRLVAGQEIAAETAQRNAREAAVIEDRKTVKPDPEGDIDARMAALLKDHEAMGARPK